MDEFDDGYSELYETMEFYSAEIDDYDEDGYCCVDYEHKYRCESHEDYYRHEEEK